MNSKEPANSISLFARKFEGMGNLIKSGRFKFFNTAYRMKAEL